MWYWDHENKADKGVRLEEWDEYCCFQITSDQQQNDLSGTSLLLFSGQNGRACSRSCCITVSFILINLTV